MAFISGADADVFDDVCTRDRTLVTGGTCYSRFKPHVVRQHCVLMSREETTVAHMIVEINAMWKHVR